MVVLALVLFLLRRCLVLEQRLLLARNLPWDRISKVLLSDQGVLNLYFCLLLGAVFLGVGLLLYAARVGTGATTSAKVLLNLLAFLVVVAFLLLPVNYGVLIASRDPLPRISELTKEQKLPEGTRTWLVWETKEEVKYFIRTGSDERALINAP